MITIERYICCMNYTPLNAIHRVWTFYRDGFRQMTWGRTLWIIILLKLFVIFVVLRIFFFQPMLKGLDDAQKSEQVGRRLKNVQINDRIRTF